ncbi:hypothetical protein BH11BAC3_BH11BAC3_03510 [soil metagenome]
MKTSHNIFCLLVLIVFSIMTWQAQSALYAAVAYINLVILLKGVGNKLLKEAKVLSGKESNGTTLIEGASQMK